MKFLTKAILVLTALLVLGSCGGNGGQPLDATSGPLVLAGLTTALNNLPKSNTVPSLPVGGISTSAVRAMATACEQVAPAVPVDSDADGIAKIKTYTFDCTDSVSGESSFSRKGSVEIQDLDETVAGMIGGIRVDFALEKFDYTDLTTNRSFGFSYNGFWNYLKQGSALVSSSEFKGTVGYETAASTKNNFSFEYTWDWVMTPDNESTPWTTGKTEFKGTYKMDGQFAIEDSGGHHKQHEGTWVIDYYSKDMTYDSTCAKWYKSGTLNLSDGANKISIEFSCSTAKLYVNGVESDWYEP